MQPLCCSRCMSSCTGGRLALHTKQPDCQIGSAQQCLNRRSDEEPFANYRNEGAFAGDRLGASTAAIYQCSVLSMSSYGWQALGSKACGVAASLAADFSRPCIRVKRLTAIDVLCCVQGRPGAWVCGSTGAHGMLHSSGETRTLHGGTCQHSCAWFSTAGVAVHALELWPWYHGQTSCNAPHMQLHSTPGSLSTFAGEHRVQFPSMRLLICREKHACFCLMLGLNKGSLSLLPTDHA